MPCLTQNGMYEFLVRDAPSTLTIDPYQGIATQFGVIRERVESLVGQTKMNRNELARFILQVAEGSHTPEDWIRISVNHYGDEKMEAARVKLVRYVLDYPPPLEEAHLSLKELLVAVAAQLKA